MGTGERAVAIGSFRRHILPLLPGWRPLEAGFKKSFEDCTMSQCGRNMLPKVDWSRSISSKRSSVPLFFSSNKRGDSFLGALLSPNQLFRRPSFQLVYSDFIALSAKGWVQVQICTCTPLQSVAKTDSYLLIHACMYCAKTIRIHVQVRASSAERNRSQLKQRRFEKPLRRPPLPCPS